MKTSLGVFALCAPATSAFVVRTSNNAGSSSALFSTVDPRRPLVRAPMAGPGPSMRPDLRPDVGNVPIVAPGEPNNLSDRARDILYGTDTIKVQGNSLKTWSFQTSAIERVQVMMKTEGRPLNANVDLWQGPDNSPQRIAVYIEDGRERPFNAIFETPGGQNAIAVRNTNTMEFPLEAQIEAEVEDAAGKGSIGFKDSVLALKESAVPRTVQGGAVFTKPFVPSVQSVQIQLQTDGRPLNARVELLQGPNNNKQVMEIYSEDGYYRPIFFIMETPGAGNVIRICNTATMEFPLYATVEPYVIDNSVSEGTQSFFIVD